MPQGRQAFITYLTYRVYRSKKALTLFHRDPHGALLAAAAVELRESAQKPRILDVVLHFLPQGCKSVAIIYFLFLFSASKLPSSSVWPEKLPLYHFGNY